VALAICRRAAPTGVDPVGNPALHIALDPTDRTRATVDKPRVLAGPSSKPLPSHAGRDTRTEVQRKNFSKHRISLEGLLTLGYIRHPRLSLQPADGVTIALYVGWLPRDVRSAAGREVLSIPAARTESNLFRAKPGKSEHRRVQTVALARTG